MLGQGGGGAGSLSSYLKLLLLLLPGQIFFVQEEAIIIFILVVVIVGSSRRFLLDPVGSLGDHVELGVNQVGDDRVLVEFGLELLDCGGGVFVRR